jgi:NADH-quinone oxidoreductase subunit J
MIELTFYAAAAIAVIATAMVVTCPHPVHALLYLVLSLLAVATVFFTLGAPFAGVLEVIVYAGAVMVLFVFVVMMLNLGKSTVEQERRWLSPRAALGPALLAGVLLYLLLRNLWGLDAAPVGLQTVGAKAIGVALYGPYLLAVELASMLLLAGLVAAYHLGKPEA